MKRLNFILSLLGFGVAAKAALDNPMIVPTPELIPWPLDSEHRREYSRLAFADKTARMEAGTCEKTNIIYALCLSCFTYGPQKNHRMKYYDGQTADLCLCWACSEIFWRLENPDQNSSLGSVPTLNEKKVAVELRNRNLHTWEFTGDVPSMVTRVRTDTSIGQDFHNKLDEEVAIFRARLGLCGFEVNGPDKWETISWCPTCMQCRDLKYTRIDHREKLTYHVVCATCNDSFEAEDCSPASSPYWIAPFLFGPYNNPAHLPPKLREAYEVGKAAGLLYDPKFTS